MVMEYVRRVAEECSLTPFYIDKKIEETKELAEEKDVSFSRPVLMGYDVQGPMVRLVDPNFYLWKNVKEAMETIPKSESIEKAIISGWDTVSLEEFRNKRLGIPMNIVGELGAVYKKDEEIYEVELVNGETFYEMVKNLFEKASEQDLKLAIQGNHSKRVYCPYIEGDEENRGNVRNHFVVKGNNPTTKDIYEQVKQISKDNFEYDGTYLVFEPTQETVKVLDDVLRRIYTLQSMRFSEKGNEIRVCRDNKDNKEFDLNDMEEFVKKAVPKGWDIDPNPDYCVDLTYEGDGKKTTKEGTANILAKELFGEDYVITNTGDKKGDVLHGENTLFFPQYGTQAQEYCIDKEISHIPVISSVDYSLILGEILRGE